MFVATPAEESASPPATQKLVAQQPAERTAACLLLLALFDAGTLAARLGLQAAAQLLDAGAGHRAPYRPPGHPPRRERHQLVAVRHACRPAYQCWQQRVRELAERELQRDDVRRCFGGEG